MYTQQQSVLNPNLSSLYLQALFNEILLNSFSEFRNKTTINPNFSDIINQTQIEAQFNPYSVENIPPRIENVNIHSDVKYSWEVLTE